MADLSNFGPFQKIICHMADLSGFTPYHKKKKFRHMADLSKLGPFWNPPSGSFVGALEDDTRGRGRKGAEEGRGRREGRWGVDSSRDMCSHAHCRPSVLKSGELRVLWKLYIQLRD